MKKLLLCLLPFLSYGQLSFSDEKLIVENIEGLNAVLAVDLNNDGLKDIVVSNFNNGNDGIGWLENLGNGSFSERVFIGAPATRVTNGDVDNDGDQDLIVLNRINQEVYWLENLENTDAFSDKKMIANDLLFLNYVQVADINTDGFLDVLIENEDFDNDTLLWLENDGIGNFLAEQAIPDSPIVPTDINIVDCDQDGYLDIVAGDLAPPYAYWYPNETGIGDFGVRQVFPGIGYEAEELQTADFNGDTFPDILVKQSNFELLKWYSNNGLGNFTSEAVLELESSGGNYVFSIFPTDLNNDDFTDILVSDRIQNEISWYKNVDGLGNFQAIETLITNSQAPFEVFTEDLDNDGDRDIIAYKRDDKNVVWYENLTVLNIEQKEELAIKAFPNPVTEDLFFQTPENIAITKIIVSDITGRTILEEKKEVISSLSLRELPSGIYLVTLTNGELLTTKKIIKQ